ncbi:MAG: tetratricopeptide repeat protein [Proteobacteria bacterium]|nr:tetratricopeptide repeat protein [Pseudomonadota bacterium]
MNLLYEGTVDGRGLDPSILPAAAPPSACVQEGIDLYRSDRHEDAIDRLQSCDEIADALRWSGLSMVQLERFDEARAALEQSVELRPRNRCRPSFNRIIRETAAAHEGVHLVDLDAAARTALPSASRSGRRRSARDAWRREP